MEFRHDDIEYADIVISHFGYWPTFHDAEVISMKFVRGMNKEQASLEMKILAFERTDKLKDGYLELAKHCLIDMEFIGLGKSEVDNFNHQNVLGGLKFGKHDHFLFCELSSSHGVAGYIEAEKIRIHKLTLSIGPNA